MTPRLGLAQRDPDGRAEIERPTKTIGSTEIDSASTEARTDDPAPTSEVPPADPSEPAGGPDPDPPVEDPSAVELLPGRPAPDPDLA